MTSRSRKIRKQIRKSKIKSRPKNLTGTIILGTGLVLVGLAALLMLPRTDSASANPSSSLPKTVPVEVNYEAPSLALVALDGEEHALADYRGQVVLVNLWATWCPPCKAEMPTLEAYYQEHADEGFALIAISDGDKEEDVRAFAQSFDLNFSVWLDPEHQATINAFRTQSLPSSFVIDREGIIRLRWVGEIERETLEEYVTPMLAQ